MEEASTEDIFCSGGWRTLISLEEGGPNWSGWRTVDASWFKGWRTLMTPTGPEDVVTSYMKNGKIKILFEYLYLWQIKILDHNFEVANWFGGWRTPSAWSGG